ncbi:MAG: dynamin family protein [bacterium]
MTIQEILVQAENIASDVGIDKQAKALRDIQTSLTNQTYRVAFLGQFKVGKSTLINKFILKEDILFTDSLEATAVPTEIEFGSPGKMEVYQFRKENLKIEGLGKSPIDREVVTGVDLIETVNNPSPDDIKQRTSAETEKGRTALTERISHVKLFHPSGNLKGFSVVDTPGINTPTPGIITTVYRIVPSSDIVVFVVQAKMLSEIEINFLRKQVFQAGISKCIIVINYDSRFIKDSDLRKIKDQIHAQLASIGRENIPVATTEASTGSATPSGQLANKANATSANETTSGADPWFDEPSAAKTQTSTTAPEKTSDFETFLIDYLRENVRPARLEKIRTKTSAQISLIENEVDIEIETLSVSDAQRQEILKDARKAFEESQASFNLLEQEFLGDMRLALNQYKIRVVETVQEICDDFCSKIDAAHSLPDMKTVLEDSKMFMNTELDTKMIRIADETTRSLNLLQNRYSVKWNEASQPWRDSHIGINLKGGAISNALENAPGFVVILGDFFLFDILVGIPFGGLPFLITIPLRLLLGNMPWLKDMMPANIALSIVKKSVKASISNEFMLIKKSIGDNIDASMSDVSERLQTAWRESVDAQQASIMEPVARASSNTSVERLGVLQNAKKDIAIVRDQITAAT